MKTIPPSCPEPEVGPKYWRSLDQVADTPEFRQWLEREFPQGASEFTDGQSRRHFVKIMSASFLFAGLGMTGCRRPEEHLMPFSKMPENYTHGGVKYYATSRPTRGSAVPLLAKSNDGRPTKIEANPQHPLGNCGTDALTQASILDLYDPDRAMAASEGAGIKSIEELTQAAKKFSANGGEGLCFLLERSSSPSRLRLQQLIAKKYPKARWFVHEPVDFAIHQQASSLAFGSSVKPEFKLANAKRILSLDCDFMGAEEDAFVGIRDYAKGRKQKTAADDLNRLYVVEALFSVTGANADHRLRQPASQVIAVGAKLAQEVIKATGGAGDLNSALEKLSADFKSDEKTDKWIVECAMDLAANKGSAVVLAGYQQPLAVHLIANALNQALGAVGKSVLLRPAPESKEGSLADLVQLLNGGGVDTLVSLGGNPVYSAPADLDLGAAQKQAKSVIRFGYYHDESAEGVTQFIPAAHYLESWGDARTSDGTYVTVQPLIDPIFGGFTEIEVLARLGGLDTARPLDIVRETFLSAGGKDDEGWKQALHDGYLANSAPAPVSGSFNTAGVKSTLSAAVVAPAPDANKLELVFHRSYSVDDGREINNGWMQEAPDPVTKIVWENVMMVSAKTAKDLGLNAARLRAHKHKETENSNFKSNDMGVPSENTDFVVIELGGRKLKGPAWIQPGLADGVVALELGYGRTKTGRVGTRSGYNAYAIRSATAPWIASGAKLTNTGDYYRVATTQEHGAMEGRPIVREANLEQYRNHPQFASNMDLDAASHTAFIPKNADGSVANIYQHPYKVAPDTVSKINQWGMVIDLSSCVGCNACVLACQSENNIPIIGKEQVNRGREMNWMRLDRYYAGDVADPQAANQPMLCQHCESAPCETVCPVNATVHDEEGVNVMAYNRCIGTRYCGNNCPYKVRRFNYFDFNKRPSNYAETVGNGLLWFGPGKLYNGPLAKRSQIEYDLIKMARNPDVTVRMRGVMEKCTFCIQRIEQTKIAKKVAAGPTDDVQITDKDGLQTACQQVCPAEAITFGNLLDPKSKVNELKANDRNYSVLGFLDTKPRLTYLARVRNPNKAMPDYTESTLAMAEYQHESHSNPYEEHHKSDGHGDAHGTKAETHAEKKGTH